MLNVIHDRPWYGPPGGDFSYWARERVRIAEYIQANKIQPVVIQAAPRQAGDNAASLPKQWRDLNIRGGITPAHLHFDNKIYVLNDEQWATFSAGIVAEVKAKLENVKEVSFEAGVLLGSVGETVAH
jgi:hypothetical protein